MEQIMCGQCNGTGYTYFQESWKETGGLRTSTTTLVCPACNGCGYLCPVDHTSASDDQVRKSLRTSITENAKIWQKLADL